ncbi:MAG: ATP-binding protein [Sterolibacteriaceae bacterium MAG5]|nr:ATP-binding protein [Candidatus Nitricoxidireducens bremensis]
MFASKQTRKTSAGSAAGKDGRRRPAGAAPMAAHRKLSPIVAPTTLLLAVAMWTALTIFSLWSQRQLLDRTAEDLARIDAVANLRKDMAIRKWASDVGGIFVNEAKAPNVDELSEQERVFAATSLGEPLKLVSLTPIHILMGIQGISNKEFGRKERLTSLQLHNSANAPDQWEKDALKSLEKGGSMVTEAMPRKGGHGLLRVMIPMRMEKECLECHRDTLVPVGGLRGGAAISLDLNTYRGAQEPAWRAIQTWHLGAWLLGMATIYAFWYFSRRRALEQAQEEETRRENETAFAAMAEGAVITDAAGKILWVNDAFCRIYGYAAEEVIGRNPRVLKSGRHDENFYREFWHQLTTAGHWRGELWNRRKDGEIFPEEISVQALRGPDGRIVRFISIFSDITERKRSEDELQKYREGLEDLVRQRTEELTVARDAAETANRSKSVFLANMSHELRTPLNAVIGFSQLMEKDTALTPTQRRNLEIIGNSGSHLLTLINDVLELSKIESGKTELAPDEVNLPDLLRQVVAMMRVRAEQSGLALRLETAGLPQMVLMDAVKLRQVLLNLLSNAVKFTAAGEVVLRAGAAPAAQGRVRIDFAVSDTGMGIAAEDQERIFQPFEQVGTRPHHGGTGLGLTISREYVRMMGGELAVESAPGQGATFRFAVVARAGEWTAPVRRRVVGLAPADRGRCILVVDDMAEARLLVRSLLEPLGFVVAEAEDGAAAEAAVASLRPALVFMDWRLPGNDGLAALRRIHARPQAERPKIVVLTANVLEESRAEAMAAGADDFMGKPYEAEDLYAVLERHLGIRFLRDEVAPPPPALPAPMPADLAGLSPALRSVLVNAAVSLSPDQIAAALQRLAAEDAALAARLRPIAERMDYHLLWQILGIADAE